MNDLVPKMEEFAQENVEKVIKEEVPSEDEEPVRPAKRKRFTIIDKKSSSLLEKIYEELLDSKRQNQYLEERISNMEKKFNEQNENIDEEKKKNEILEKRIQMMEERNSLEERHIPISETIRAACHYLMEASKIIDSENRRILDSDDKDKILELTGRVEANQGGIEELRNQIYGLVARNKALGHEMIQNSDELNKMKQSIPNIKNQFNQMKQSTTNQLKNMRKQLQNLSENQRNHSFCHVQIQKKLKDLMVVVNEMNQKSERIENGVTDLRVKVAELLREFLAIFKRSLGMTDASDEINFGDSDTSFHYDSN